MDSMSNNDKINNIDGFKFTGRIRMYIDETGMRQSDPVGMSSKFDKFYSRALMISKKYNKNDKSRRWTHYSKKGNKF